MRLGSIQRDIANPEVTELWNYRGSLRLARIVEVYDASFLESAASSEKYKYGKVKLLWLDGKGAVPKLLDVCKPWFSWKRGSAILSMPEKDDIVVCQERPDGYPVILGFLPYKWDVASKQIRSASDDSVGPLRPLHSGEVLLKSSSQAEVFLTKDGNIKIIASDPTQTTKVVSDVESNCTEQLFNRVDNSKPRVIECTFGYDFLDENNPVLVGSSPQVCSIGTYTTATISLSFPFEKSISFILNDDTILDSITNVSIRENKKDSMKSEVIDKTRYNLIKKSIYTPGSRNAGTENLKPCSTETNSYLYSIEFLDNVKHTDRDIVTLTCDVKKFSGGIRLNSYGDLFLDGRNVILRSKNGKSSLSLTEDGLSELRGVRTILGNRYEGVVRCDSTGVKFYSGVANDSTVVKANSSDLLMPPSYFYVLDSYPLIKLHKVSGVWKFEGVTKEEYSQLNEYTKVSVGKMLVSANTSLLTKEALEKMLEDGFPSYSELKSSL